MFNNKSGSQQGQQQKQKPIYERGNYNYGEKRQPDGRATSSGTANPPPKKERK